jgi:hypothetical protein
LCKEVTNLQANKYYKMKRMTFIKTIALSVAAISFSTITRAQEVKASPAATTLGSIRGANITITYSSPGVKGREIWGKLVPYDRPWRAGANESTTFITDRDIKVEGQTLPKGKYSLFMTPTAAGGWTIIFNSETGQWGIKHSGEANFDPAKNVLTVTVKARKSSTFNERLVYEIEDRGVVLKWENLEVPISIL